MQLSRQSVSVVGVIGSGQIGPDIALFFANNGTNVVVVDIATEALARGEARVKAKVEKLVSKGRLKPEKAEDLLARLEFTTDYQGLAKAQLVIEAASEDLAIKNEIFAKLAALVAEDAVIASNSSHLVPDQLFAELPHPERALVTHFFYPADRNPAVELVAGERTDEALVRELMALFELAGKLPVRVAQRYGYAVDPVFEGLAQAACLAVERGLGSVPEVDAVCQRALGQGVGPFTALNLVGGNPLIHIGLTHLHDAAMPWFRSPELLKNQLANGEAWPTAARGEEVTLPEERERQLADWMLGAYFCLVGEVLDAELIGPADYEDVLGLAMDIHPPLSLMNRIGIERAWELARAFAEKNEGMRPPQCLSKRAEGAEPWPLLHVQREDHDGVAVITIRRFKVLNALNARVLAQLERHAEELATDESIQAVVVRGFGTRAFVSGADIKELAALKDPAQAEQLALRGQRAFSALAALKKPVIAAMNGLAFGGGNELAMACHERIAARGQRVFVGQPEPKLGVIPGYGGTQRLPRLIGLQAAWPLLRTGNPISSAQALELGLVREELSPEELLPRAMELARAIADGKESLTPIEQGPLQIPDALPNVDIGGLSTAIDALVQEATLEGAKTTLQRGLELEAAAFGRCLDCEDYRIGMRNFLENGPRSAATFLHR